MFDPDERITDEGGLNGFAEWYDGVTHTSARSFEALRTELLATPRPTWATWPAAAPREEDAYGYA